MLTCPEVQKTTLTSHIVWWDKCRFTHSMYFETVHCVQNIVYIYGGEQHRKSITKHKPNYKVFLKETNRMLSSESRAGDGRRKPI